MALKTRNLNEAAYLITRGYRCKIEKLSDNVSIFHFKNEAIKASNSFLTGKAVMNLSKFLCARFQLKHELKGYDIQDEGDAGRKGRAYYYFSEDKVLQHAIYGSNPIHKLRFEKGNYFEEKEKAEYKNSFYK